MSRNSPDYIVAWYACLKSGIVMSSINITYTPKEIAYQVGHARPALIIAEPLFAPRIAQTLAEAKGAFDFVKHVVTSDLTIPANSVEKGWKSLKSLVETGNPDEAPWEALDIVEDDIAMMQYTSGTESLPKGVLISHRSFLISTTPAWNSALEVMPTDTWLFVMPFFTMAGLGSMTTLTILGATIVLVQAIDAAQAIDILVDDDVSIMAQTPTFYLAMSQQPNFSRLSKSRLRRCMTYGGAIPPAMIQAWSGKGNDLVWGTYWWGFYDLNCPLSAQPHLTLHTLFLNRGQSELTQLGSVGWLKTLDEIPGGDLGWIGQPVPQLECKIVDESGKEVGIGEEGELMCRSPSVMLGYYRNPEKTAETIKNGWLATGDFVRRDENWNLFFCDRRKDLIKTGGHKWVCKTIDSVWLIGLTKVFVRSFLF